MTALRASLFLLAASLIPACADSASVDDDDLAGESELDGEEAKTDGVSTFTFFQVTPHLGPCRAGEECSDRYVSRVNRTTTACTPGVSKAKCGIDKIDWTGTGLPSSVASAYEVDASRGGPVLLRGSLVNRVLRVTEVWGAGSDTGVEDGVFVLILDNGKRCSRAPCMNFDELRLNSTRSGTISGIDFEPSGADEVSIERASEALFNGGTIVVGERADAGGARTRTANQFYVRAPTPMH